MIQRKSQSKVNQLRAINAELTQKVNYHAQVTAQVMQWVHKSCTDEQKLEFTAFIREICNDLAQKE